MNFIHPNIVPALPEIFILVMVCIILVVDLFLTDKNRIITYLLSQATLLGAAVLTVSLISNRPEMTFSDTFINDSFANILKMFVYLICIRLFARLPDDTAIIQG